MSGVFKDMDEKKIDDQTTAGGSQPNSGRGNIKNAYNSIYTVNANSALANIYAPEKVEKVPEKLNNVTDAFNTTTTISGNHFGSNVNKPTNTGYPKPEGFEKLPSRD